MRSAVGQPLPAYALYREATPLGPLRVCLLPVKFVYHPRSTSRTVSNQGACLWTCIPVDNVHLAQGMLARSKCIALASMVRRFGTVGLASFREALFDIAADVLRFPWPQGRLRNGRL